MLVIKNMDTLYGKCIGNYKVYNVRLESDTYNIKVIHNDSPFDMFNIMIDRCRTKQGDYRIYCYETHTEYHIPIEVIRDRDEFLSTLIYKLI